MKGAVRCAQVWKNVVTWTTSTKDKTSTLVGRCHCLNKANGGASVQVCMKEGARGVKEAAYFLSSGCEPLRTGLGISSLLLPQVFASHMAAALGSGNPTLDLGNEIHWDDFEADDKKLSAAAFMNHMSVMKVWLCCHAIVIRFIVRCVNGNAGNNSQVASRGDCHATATIHLDVTFGVVRVFL